MYPFIRLPFSLSATLTATVLATVASLASAMQEGGLAPPRYETTDKFGVNLSSGQVTAHLETVAIGGETGLSHSISGYTNSFYENRGHYGYSDKYTGRAEGVSLGPIAKIDGSSNIYQHSYVFRVFALGQTEDFKVIQDGVYVSFPDVDRPFSYEALGDTRHTLTRDASQGEMYWTQPDGTIVTFADGGSVQGGRLRKIVYPNGFRISIHGNNSVTTNTGYQLKYDYIHDNRGLETAKRGRVFAAGTSVPQAASGIWSSRNPKYIHGINNAIEYCNPDQHTPCTLRHNWPKATFNWPGGMPRAFFIDDSVFSVTHPNGSTTRYHYQAHDLGLKDPHDPSKGKHPDDSVTLNKDFAPRFVALKPADAQDITLRYTYENKFDRFGRNYGAWGHAFSYLGRNTGIIHTASGIEGNFRYEEGEPTGGSGAYPIQWRGAQLSVTSYQDLPTALLGVSSAHQGSIRFEGNYRNFVTFTRDIQGGEANYAYDTRGNLSSITYQRGKADQTQQRAYFPENCDNRRTCNKPLWVEDARGHRTDYTYHAQSGQVASVKLPANEQGVRATTYYEYTQLHAHVKNASGHRVQVSDPIWMLTAEKQCANSASCAGAADEIVTRYEYQHDNLLMTGMTVSSGGQTLRTCYRYDIYGHRIGETDPNANLTSCE